jgi:hypothetical protein
MNGGEAYNTNNMCGIDGPSFYRDNGAAEFYYDPAAWENKTDKEGIDWVLEEDAWIPILVEGIDSQLMHAPGGEPLTVEMAMNGYTPVYYNDETRIKPTNALARDDLDNINMPQLFEQMVKQGFVHAKVATGETKIATVVQAVKKNPLNTCDNCSLNNVFVTPNADHGLLCNACTETLVTCESCGNWVIGDDKCWSDYLEAHVCDGCYCDSHYNCDLCGDTFHNEESSPEHINSVFVGVLCSDCYQNNTFCTICEWYRPNAEITSASKIVNSTLDLCISCVRACPEENHYFLKTEKDPTCPTCDVPHVNS